MTEDPIVEEARRAGRALFERFNHDMRAVVEYLRHRQAQHHRLIVPLPPKPPRRRPAARK